MFKISNIDFKHSGSLNPLVSDYIEKKEELKPFHSFYSDLSGFKSLLNTLPYSSFDRETLYAILTRQNQSVKNTSQKTLQNISALKEKNVFTVTTGHQLCLFTGPLYFIYKIISAINLAEHLSNEFPGHKFVPVYWLASEDHDFEEVNHLHVFGKKLVWQSEQKGAVGDFKTSELFNLLEELKTILGKSENADTIVQLFKTSYLEHHSLSEATRFLVNALFGEYGLVIVDGNDKVFKNRFKEYLRKDILQQSYFKAVNETSETLSALGYKLQVNARNINCFYLEEGLRARIESKGSGFEVVGHPLSFTNEEMASLAEHHPEKISPNVVLRPLYQQCILPNIAYVGGPGEVAYWLQLKNMFDKEGVLFPILVPRNFVTIIEKSVKNKIDKLNFKEEDFFNSETELIKTLQLKTGDVFEVSKEKENLSTLFSSIAEKVKTIDKTIEASVNAEMQKSLSGLENISAKANRALKQKLENEVLQIKTVKQKLFPGLIPQERHENFASLYLRFGSYFIKSLKENLNPLTLSHFIFTEE